MSLGEITLMRARLGEEVLRFAESRQEATEEDSKKRIAGIAAPYKSWTTIYNSKWMEIREQYSPGCFAESLASGDDIRCCRNHIREDILGRLSNDTLKLNEKDDGLYYDVLLNSADPTAMRVHAQVERKDIAGASTVFRVLDMDTKEKKRDGKWIFMDTILRGKLIEAGPVTDPAYLDTTATANMIRMAGVDEQRAINREFDELLQKLSMEA